jgi:hypothetical protein
MKKSASVRLVGIVLCLAMVAPLALSYQVVAEQEHELDVYYERNSPQRDLMDKLSQRPGGFAWDYIQNDTYNKMLVEVDCFNTMYYNMRVDYFRLYREMLTSYCVKQEVSFKFEDTVSLGGFAAPTVIKAGYDLDDLKGLARSSSDHRTGGDTCVMHVLVMNGYYEPDPEMVGLALDSCTFVVFPREMEPRQVAILVGHEFGHLLGLVGTIGLDEVFNPPGAWSHYDLKEPKHCTEPRCIMNYTIDTFDSLCDKCIEDLEFLKGSICPYTINETAPRIDRTVFGVSLALTMNVIVIGYAAMVAQDQSLSSQMARRAIEVKTSSESLARWTKVLFLSAREVSDESMNYVLEPANVTEGRTSRLTLILSVITIIVILVLAYYL